ncbi:TatD DNase family protein [Variovorax sp. YR752]|uniref:TatD family hydrolase n=1 Tax=Variovorax sp. YR752 TaxID=1884383 RepID=UPI000BC99054|nr:TatD family hydrolase [Variovorax sp. YR752]SOE06384.1 TatD DNase family protein [Variovorax sp. YR752]
MSTNSSGDRPQLVDIGVNFHAAQLVSLTDALLVRAKAAGVTQILATGTSLASSRLARDLAKANPGVVFATAGVHPHGAKSCDPNTLRELAELWKCSQVVAIGECGLDYNRNFSTPQLQRIAFERQLSMALGIRKPFFLHCRDAFTDFHDMLAPVVADGARGVVHCFTGDRAEAEAFLGMGLDIGITGWVSDLKRGMALREAISAIPLDRLHLETDAPYLLPKNPGVRRGHNEPANLRWIAISVAELMNRDVEEIIQACSGNSRRMFGLPSV